MPTHQVGYDPLYCELGAGGRGHGGARSRWEDIMTGDAVAVLGTGIMGSAMARNLVAAGLPTMVWDGSPAATAPLASAGARVAASAADAIAGAQVVITMLPTADAVDSVIRGHGLNAFAR